MNAWVEVSLEQNPIHFNLENKWVLFSLFHFFFPPEHKVKGKMIMLSYSSTPIFYSVFLKILKQFVLFLPLCVFPPSTFFAFSYFWQWAYTLLTTPYKIGPSCLPHGVPFVLSLWAWALLVWFTMGLWAFLTHPKFLRFEHGL